VPKCNEAILAMLEPCYIEYCRKGKHSYVDYFDLDQTIKCVDFLKYYSIRKKAPKTPVKSLYKKFGRDFVRHFEMAYNTCIAAGIDINFEDLYDY